MGGSAFGQVNIFDNALPQGDLPGSWVEVEGQISLDLDKPNEDHGIFLCVNLSELLPWLAETIYEVEVHGGSDFIQSHGYTVAKRARLVRRLYEDTWTDGLARAFALNCAEHVLQVVAEGELRGELEKIVAQARTLANSLLEDVEVHDAFEMLGNKAEAIASRLPKLGDSAARAVAEASHGYRTGAEAARNAAKAARAAMGHSDAEFAWQVQELTSLLLPNPPPGN